MRSASINSRGGRSPIGPLRGTESSRAVVVLVARPQCHGLEDEDQQRQPHGQLRKDVVKRHREGEVQTVNRQSVHKLEAYKALGLPDPKLLQECDHRAPVGECRLEQV
jgi:hypothetical protein